MALWRLPCSLLEYTLLSRCHAGRGVRFVSTSIDDKRVRLRFAPSPTGYLHLGGLRTALFNHLLARSQGGSWLLRIEDTDQARLVEGAAESLIKTLKWSKLDYDEGPDKDLGHGPYLQSKRKPIYDNYLDRLLDSGDAYHCFCSSDRLAETRKLQQKQGKSASYDRKCLGISRSEARERLAQGASSVVRFKNTTTSLKQYDMVYDTINYPSLPIEDFVLRKTDGLPTYHFANVVDDHEMGVTHVLRGEEWLPSTPKHLALYAALGLDPPKFGHMPLLINPDGSKLSKRAGDVRVEDYIERGYEPEALLNFVALMGWSPPSAADSSESEIFTLDDLVNKFTVDRINKSRATMSTTKLDFLNRAHVQDKVRPGNHSGRSEVARNAQRYISAAYSECQNAHDLTYVLRVVVALQERLHTVKDIPTLGSYFFAAPDYASPAAGVVFRTVPKETHRVAIEASLRSVKALPEQAFAEDGTVVIQTALDDLVGLDPLKSTKDLMNPLRHALTGQKVGASVAATIGVLGREETLTRLGAALSHISRL